MSYSTTPAFSLFPAATTSPNAFSMFGTSQSPRETYTMYDDLCHALRPSGGAAVPKRKCSSFSMGLKKIFRLPIPPSPTPALHAHSHLALLRPLRRRFTTVRNPVARTLMQRSSRASPPYRRPEA
ncbi:hypothetical protein BKA93DRAFT_821360 [Sparassis latifolia]